MFPYERIVAWAAGPVSAGAGLLTAWLATKLGIVAAHQSAVQHDLTAGGIFVVTAAVSYAAHHKWLDNLAKWWTKTPFTGGFVAGTSAVPPPSPTTTISSSSSPNQPNNPTT